MQAEGCQRCRERSRKDTGCSLRHYCIIQCKTVKTEKKNRSGDDDEKVMKIDLLYSNLATKQQQVRE